jgi:hypothetical protein
MGIVLANVGLRALSDGIRVERRACARSFGWIILMAA